MINFHKICNIINFLICISISDSARCNESDSFSDKCKKRFFGIELNFLTFNKLKDFKNKNL